MRLNLRLWIVSFIILATIILFTPVLWRKLEKFETRADYRIPYDISKDYWLYSRRLGQVASREKVILLGDSVVWGEYVLPDGSLSHFLNQQSGAADRFINGGLNGLFPLAEEGLVRYYSRSVARQKVIVQFNLLWLTSPKADLSTLKEEQFNHSRLVPQFIPRIPCYKADTNERLTAAIERQVTFLQWVQHLQYVYFGQKSILRWTLQEDGGEPPLYPNAWKNPLTQLTLQVPPAPVEDPQRGPRSPRHKPWSQTGEGTARFEWVELKSSLQWHAFERVLSTLQNRGNDVLIILGPFNEHIMAEENRATYERLRDEAVAWFRQNRIPLLIPDTLPSLLYADASHPLTEGYQLLAKRIFEDKAFQEWLQK